MLRHFFLTWIETSRKTVYFQNADPFIDQINNRKITLFAECMSAYKSN